MDVLVCVGLTALELLIIQSFSPEVPDRVAAATVFVSQYITLKCYRIFLYPKYFSPLRDVPGPKDNHFLFGQLINLLRAPTPTSLHIKWMKERPDAPFIRYLGFLNNEVLVANSLATHKNVLYENCYNFSKPEWFCRLTKEIVGDGLILMEGNEHRAHRKMLTNSFALSSIRKMEPVFREKAKDICEFLDQKIAANDGDAGTFDCIDTFKKAILDILGTVILGVDLNYFQPCEDRLPDLKNVKVNTFEQGRTLHEAFEVFFSPGPVGKLLLFANAFVPTRWIPVEANREFLSAMAWVNSMLRDLIRHRYKTVSEAKAAGTHETKDSRDLVTSIVDEIPRDAMGEEEFLGHVLEVMAAGHDTSANMLSWSCYIMATRHDIQDRLRQDITSLGSNATFAQLDKLSYLDGFVKESMRVYPPATIFHRAANKNIVVEGIRIPKGTMIDICPSVTLANPHIWGHDVDQIDPTRWEPERLKGEQLNPYAFSPFSNGPRICIGRLFSMFEIKLILAEMVRNYRFLDVEKPFTVESPSLTLRPVGMQIRVGKV